VRTLPHSVYTAISTKGELTLTVPASSIKEVLLFLRDHTNCQFKVLIDICGVDYPEKAARFEVVYHLLSVKYNSRIRVKSYVNDVQPIESAVHLYKSAN
jgi:NADH dehydrogenase (ubiquinone) Fe-S protein 3